MPSGLLSEGVRFALVGLVATATHFLVALGLIAGKLDVFLADIAGFATALCVSVLGHHRYSFPGRVSFFYGASRFLPAALIAFAANLLLLSALDHSASSPPEWLRLTLAVGVMPIVTFLYARFFAYR